MKKFLCTILMMGATWQVFGAEDWVPGARDSAVAGLASMEAEWAKLQNNLASAQTDYNAADAEVSALNAQIELKKLINKGSNASTVGAAATTPDKDALREALDAGAGVVNQQNELAALKAKREAALAKMSAAKGQFEATQAELNRLGGQFAGVKERIRDLNNKLGLDEETGITAPVDRSDLAEFEPGANDEKADKKKQKRQRDEARTVNNRGVRPTRGARGPGGGDCGRH